MQQESCRNPRGAWVHREALSVQGPARGPGWSDGRRPYQV